MTQKDSDRIYALLDKWQSLITTGKKRAYVNAKRVLGSLYARVTTYDSQIINPDQRWTQAQNAIRKELCDLLPEIQSVIAMEPELNGHWSAKDYIDLFASHYLTTIDRVRHYLEEGRRMTE